MPKIGCCGSISRIVRRKRAHNPLLLAAGFDNVESHVPCAGRAERRDDTCEERRLDPLVALRDD